MKVESNETNSISAATRSARPRPISTSASSAAAPSPVLETERLRLFVPMMLDEPVDVQVTERTAADAKLDPAEAVRRDGDAFPQLTTSSLICAVIR